MPFMKKEDPHLCEEEMNDLCRWKHKTVRFNVINTTPSVTANHQGSWIWFVPLANTCIFPVNIVDLNRYLGSEGEGSVILAGNEGGRILVCISGKLLIAETGNVPWLKRTGTCLFTCLSKNKTECTAKWMCSSQSLTSAQAKLLYCIICPHVWWELLMWRNSGQQKPIRASSFWDLLMNEYLSIKRKPEPPKEQCGVVFFSSLKLFYSLRWGKWTPKIALCRILLMSWVLVTTLCPLR